MKAAAAQHQGGQISIWAILTNHEFDVKPKQSPGGVQDLAVDAVQLLVHAAKEAAADDRDGDGEADEAEDARKDNLLPQAYACFDKDGDWEADDCKFGVSSVDPNQGGEGNGKAH